MTTPTFFLVFALVILALSATAALLAKGRLGDVEAKLNETKQLYEAETANIVRALDSLNDLLGIQQAVLGEVAPLSEERTTQRAAEMLYSHKQGLNKLIHHCKVSSSDEREALRSSWALATQFGEADSLKILRDLEPSRTAGNLSQFQEHRSILERRLAGDL